jgi:MFS family permease
VTSRAIASDPIDVRPMRSLWLLTVAHAFNHAQAALLPLVYLAVIGQFGVSVAAIALLASVGSVLSGLMQLSYSDLTRRVSRRSILAVGNVVFGAFMAFQALASSFIPFATASVISKLGASQQHPVGNGLLTEQFPASRWGFAISTHIAGGNVGTVAVPLIGAWLIAGLGWGWAVVLFGIPPILIGIAMAALIRETGADRAAALAHGSLRDAFRSVLRDRNMLLLFASAAAGGGARGLGVLNLFVPLYLSLVIGLDDGTVALMLTGLLIGSVPGPIIAGLLSDRLGRKPLIVAVYLGGTVALGLLLLAGSNILALWVAILILSVFAFVESPQLQSLLADIAPAAIRDASFSVYFTLAFGVGALWTAVYGALIGTLGNDAGLAAVFAVMAAANVLAALLVLPIREDRPAAGGRVSVPLGREIP